MRHASALLFAVLAVVGCASAAGTGTSSQTQAPARGDANVITLQELGTVSEGDLYSAIQRLRPAFFQTRGSSSLGVATAPEAIQVYVNGSRSAGLNTLRQIRPGEVKEVRRLSAGEATQRYGTGHTLGAIVVTTK